MSKITQQVGVKSSVMWLIALGLASYGVADVCAGISEKEGKALAKEAGNLADDHSELFASENPNESLFVSCGGFLW